MSGIQGMLCSSLRAYLGNAIDRSTITDQISSAKHSIASGGFGLPFLLGIYNLEAEVRPVKPIEDGLIRTIGTVKRRLKNKEDLIAYLNRKSSEPYLGLYINPNGVVRTVLQYPLRPTQGEAQIYGLLGVNINKIDKKNGKILIDRLGFRQTQYRHLELLKRSVTNPGGFIATYKFKHLKRLHELASSTSEMESEKFDDMVSILTKKKTSKTDMERLIAFFGHYRGSIVLGNTEISAKETDGIYLTRRYRETVELLFSRVVPPILTDLRRIRTKILDGKKAVTVYGRMDSVSLDFLYYDTDWGINIPFRIEEMEDRRRFIVLSLLLHTTKTNHISKYAEKRTFDPKGIERLKKKCDSINQGLGKKS